MSFTLLFYWFLVFGVLSDDVGLNTMQVQRTLQLQIEEQGRYLQMMIEKQQQKMQEKKNVSFFWLIIDARSWHFSSITKFYPKAINLQPSITETLQSGSSTLDQSESPSGAAKKRVREIKCYRDCRSWKWWYWLSNLGLKFLFLLYI